MTGDSLEGIFRAIRVFRLDLSPSPYSPRPGSLLRRKA